MVLDKYCMHVRTVEVMQVVVVPHAMCQCTQHNMHLHWVAFDCSSTCLHRNPTGAACTAQQDTGTSLQSDGVQRRTRAPTPASTHPRHSHPPIRRTCGFGHPGISAPSFVGRSQDRRPKRQAYQIQNERIESRPTVRRKQARRPKEASQRSGALTIVGF